MHPKSSKWWIWESNSWFTQGRGCPCNHYFAPGFLSEYTKHQGGRGLVKVQALIQSIQGGVQGPGCLTSSQVILMLHSRGHPLRCHLPVLTTEMLSRNQQQLEYASYKGGYIEAVGETASHLYSSTGRAHSYTSRSSHGSHHG